MLEFRRHPVKTLGVALGCCVVTIAGLCSMLAGAAPHDPPEQDPAAHGPSPATPRSDLHLDRSGRRQFGKASYYADNYSGKPMADGTPLHLYSNNAASLTLPLGTTAKVTNLDTGLSAIVTIRDRGPYVRGRIVDLSPATARKIGIDRRIGVARVEVAPLAVPLPDGSIRLAASATNTQPSAHPGSYRW